MNLPTVTDETTSAEFRERFEADPENEGLFLRSVHPLEDGGFDVVVVAAVKPYRPPEPSGDDVQVKSRVRDYSPMIEAGAPKGMSDVPLHQWQPTLRRRAR